MEFEQVIGTRHSCRRFLQERPSDDTLAGIFRTAGMTPSWCNTQPWSTYLVKGESTRRLSAHLRAHVLAKEPHPLSSDIDFPEIYMGVYADRRREAGYALYNALGIDRTDREARTAAMLENYEFFGAPVVAIVTADAAQGTYAAIDTGAYVTNLMNAAWDAGVGSVAQGAIALHAGRLREVLPIPTAQHVVCAVALGYPDTDHPANRFRTTRAAHSELVHEVTVA